MKKTIYTTTLILFMLIGTNLWAKNSNDIPIIPPEFSLLTIDNVLTIEDASPGLTLDGRKPLLLVHGWSFDGKPAPPGGGFWDDFRTYFNNNEELKANFKPYLVRYYSNAVSIKLLSEAFRNKVEEMGFQDKKIAIIGHSMGGLLSRTYMYEQTFTKGISKNKKCGENVDLLITLGSPHHGSPMANGPARDDHVNFIIKITLGTIETFVFKETKYNEVNRSDLRWDNHDGLFNYQAFPNDRNDWLVNLNTNTEFDKKIICFSASVEGKPQFVTGEEYIFGAYIIQEGFAFVNDGIVPVKSAEFEGHTLKRTQHFSDYDHTDICRGKENKNELFDPIKHDLKDVAPLKLTWPTDTNIFVKHSQFKTIEWEAPSTVKKVNLYFSDNNGLWFSPIDSNIDASIGEYIWKFPDINSAECLIRVVNADFETEASISEHPFTIYHNKEIITSPYSNDYVIRNKTHTIEWRQSGIGQKVRLIYLDSINNIEKLIVEETPSHNGLNSYNWIADETFTPTNKGVIQIQIIALNEFVSDAEIYKFNSNYFQILGEPKFTILSPLTNPTDYFGTEGEELLVGDLNTIQWKAEGEINFIAFYLCDKNKEKIKLISSLNTTPALEVTSDIKWHIPEIYGDEFYFCVQGGYSIDSLQLEVFSDRSFRINLKPHIISPTSNESNISLLPCIEVDAVKNAKRYKFYLHDIDSTNNSKWEYESNDRIFCIANELANELKSGKSYQLTAIAFTDSFQTYTDQITFKTKESSPWNFAITNPKNGDSISENELLISWMRAVGTSGYTIKIINQNNTETIIADDLSDMDTTFTLNVSNLKFFESYQLKLIATNDFGQSIATKNFKRVYKTNINELSNPTNIVELINYPNPFSGETTFEFNIENGSFVDLSIYDLNGRKMATVVNSFLNEGIHKIKWNTNNSLKMNDKKGLYIYQISIDGRTFEKLLMIK